ncbi:hypothetical protein Patl1_37413 [Pistacia atlantica]|nr:hypothetical protein Patl1_37413 [Pistacia atlantica]
MSNERTFSATEDKAFLYRTLAKIAEMLSADMEKEGLRGRTLTLKLKTASFEVRTRAVTLQKHIYSSEDIFKHASVLLKAELPVTLRLIGLRMSQFNEEKVGAPADPTQKTLTNFIMPGDASRKNVGDDNCLGSDVSDHHFMDDKETSISLGIHKRSHCVFRDSFDNKCVPDLDDNYHRCTYNVGEAEKIHEPSSDETAEKENKSDMIGHSPKYHHNEESQLLEANSSVLQHYEGSHHDTIEAANSLDKEAVSSSNQEDQNFWVDDYKCSLRGIQMPPTFVEERQEHSDFHLAQRLQKEESGTELRILMPRQRCVRKDPASHGKRKKLKSDKKEGRHLSIDMFFVKSNQNF